MVESQLSEILFNLIPTKLLQQYKVNIFVSVHFNNGLWLPQYSILKNGDQLIALIEENQAKTKYTRLISKQYGNF